MVNITQSDMLNERQVAEVLRERWKADVEHFGTFSEVDWNIVRDGRTVAVAELKCRKVPSTTYPTVFLSVAKYNALKDRSETLGVPALFVVRFTDSIKYINIVSVETYAQTNAGRYDRGQPGDVEPMYLVPIANMTCLSAHPGSSLG